MPKADNHASANAAARQASNELLGVARGKAAVAVDAQRDRFAATAAAVKRAGTGSWTSNPDTIYYANSGKQRRTT